MSPRRKAKLPTGQEIVKNMSNITESRICQNCHKEFAITPDDFLFYEKIKVPPPTFCPECRLIRRLIMRNERTLYKRKCDLCGEEKILIYPKDSQYKVYCFDCFHSDKFDGTIYAQDYDFSKTFFEQYEKLFKNVPRLGIIKQGFINNSEYTNRVSDLKNCYLIFASNRNEDCLYGELFWESKNCMDCYNVHKCEKCFECIDCYSCNGLKYSKECSECIDSYFMLNCRNCQNCFGCTNLRNKSYCIFNEQYEKGAYLERISELKITNRNDLENIKKIVYQKSLENIVPSMVEHHSTNSSGNWIESSKNVKMSFNCEKVEEGKYSFGIFGSKDIMDYTYWGLSSELIYESCSIGRQCSAVSFCSESWDQLIKAEYCINCRSSSNLFGCVGLYKKQYCILNKQYTKESFDELRTKIIQHMMDFPFTDKVGRILRYGEYFPCDMLPFAYNETIAQQFFPKTKEEVIINGYRWKEPDTKNYVATVLSNELPLDIKFVSDNILSEVISCAHEGKCNQQCTTAFKIVPNELQFYRVNNIPLPILCPNCRHYERLLKRQPIRLWHRGCMCEQENHGHVGLCQNEFETSYALDRPETVYCLDCYRKEVV